MASKESRMLWVTRDEYVVLTWVREMMTLQGYPNHAKYLKDMIERWDADRFGNTLVKEST